jgi:predicted metalloprotease with PDZ domain
VECLNKNLSRYFDTPGRQFHSLEQSSFNAWVKLYRPDENSMNSSISYYLKGGIVFLLLAAELVNTGKNLKEFIHILWKRQNRILSMMQSKS